MTLAEIKAMFQPGTTWNAATPYTKTSGPRRAVGVHNSHMTWQTEQSPKLLYMEWPKASQIIEARDGFVRWYLLRQDELMPSEKASPVITLSRQDALFAEVTADDTVTT
jgi:hypothetical protein